MTKNSAELSAQGIDEVFRCVGSPVYFTRHFPPGFRSYLEGLVSLLEQNQFVIAKMDRSSGKTTAWTTYVLWKALFHNDSCTAILCVNRNMADEIMCAISLRLDSLPGWVQVPTLKRNHTLIEFKNGSIIAVTTSADQVWRFSSDLVLVDEFAFLRPAEQREFVECVLPILRARGNCQVAVVSSPSPDNGSQFDTLWNANHSSFASFEVSEVSNQNGRQYAVTSESVCTV